MESSELARDQSIGAATNHVNYLRLENYQNRLQDINSLETLSLNQQDLNFIEAMGYVDQVKDFIGSPENILGSDATKHGEIAENVEVNIRNAREVLEGLEPKSTFDGVGRFAPEDYKINGIDVQSKFINGANNNLNHVLEHMDKYENFVNDGSYYHIPKDTHEIIEALRKGENPEGYNSRTIRAILDKVDRIEKQTGQSYDEVVKPGISDYAEVQQGKIGETIEKHQEDLTNQNKSKKARIKEEAKDKKEVAHQASKPSLKEGLKVGAMSAAIGGVMRSGVSVYKKVDEGKSLSDFTEEDWKEVGFDFAKGGTTGGLTGFSIYGLTNYTSMSAPMASAYTSATFGIVRLCLSYKNGDIELDEFAEQGQVLCLETGMVSIGAVVGQAVIPIPVLGAVVGSITTSILTSFAKDYLGKESAKLEAYLKMKYENILNKIDEEYKKIVEEIMAEYKRLGRLTAMAFDTNLNAEIRFYQSRKLALAHGVNHSEILKSIEEVDDYFL